MFAKILAFLKSLLPFVVSKADKVAPEIQREIDRIFGEAKAKVDGLKATHSLASIKTQMEDDIAAVRETAEHHVALIKQLAEAKIAGASKLLPDVASQLGYDEWRARLSAVSAGLDPTKPAEPLPPLTQ